MPPTFEELTPAQREEIQHALVRRYIARLDREAWDRDYRRERYTRIVRPRIYMLKRLAKTTGD
jgi:hypothetical protein